MLNKWLVEMLLVHWVFVNNLAMQFVELSKFVRMLFEWIVLKCNNFIYYFTGTGFILEVTVTMFILPYFHRDYEAQS